MLGLADTNAATRLRARQPEGAPVSTQGRGGGLGARHSALSYERAGPIELQLREEVAKLLARRDAGTIL
jgi:hypothetical protein